MLLGTIIGVSQRVVTLTDYNERRDALDQRWAEFLTYCGLIPVLFPNHPPTVSRMLETLHLTGFLLTGGNSLMHLGGDAPERDESESLMLEFAITQSKPILGVCRGMQFIQNHFQVPLENVTGHVTSSHRIVGDSAERMVNSYHNFGTRSTHPELNVLARAEDGVVEAIRHLRLPIQGIMWHPERCSPFDPEDRALFVDFYASTCP